MQLQNYYYFPFNILINHKMQVVYAFIFGFIIVIIGLTLLLSVFALRSMRRVFYTFSIKFKGLFQNEYIMYATYVTFAIIGIIFIESVWKYISLDDHLDARSSKLKDYALDKFELVKAEHSENYLQLYKQYREYYLAERNIMLTSTALFAYFVFQRLVANIKKLCDLEHQIESPQPHHQSHSKQQDKKKV